MNYINFEDECCYIDNNNKLYLFTCMMINKDKLCMDYVIE